MQNCRDERGQPGRATGRRERGSAHNDPGGRNCDACSDKTKGGDQPELDTAAPGATPDQGQGQDEIVQIVKPLSEYFHAFCAARV
jgi:hypothetical protein